MNEQFKVGTICIGQNYVRDVIRNGMECEVIGALEVRNVWLTGECIFSEELCYRVRWADGTVWAAAPYQLRRKPPKQSDKEWADEAIRKLKKQSSDHVAVQLADAIPEEA